MKGLKYVTIFLLFINSVAFCMSTKSINYMELEVTRSGKIIPNGKISSADILIYVPQNCYDINSNVNWSLTKDRYGNNMVHLHWNNLNSESSYYVTARVKNIANYIQTPEKFVKGNYIETPLLKSNSNMMKFAYGRNSIDGVVKLFKFVSSFKYDKSLSDVQMPADWTFENKRGTCDELSNCLISLFLISGIKSRAVVGYAYRSPKDKTLGNHAWVQILTDKGWMNADPTWNELGYLDASHVVLAYLPDTNMTESLQYLGTGSIKWIKNDDKFNIINYTYSEPIKISSSYEGGNEGYIKANLIGPCFMADLNILSCVDANKPVLNIRDKRRSVWFCGNKSVYWAYDSKNFNGICPTKIYDQSGVTNTVNIRSGKTTGNVIITSPDTVNVGDEFSLEVFTNKNFVLFSPNISLPSAKKLKIRLWDPGIYKFYAFDGRLYEKDVNIVKKKIFNIHIISLDKVKGNFNVSVIVNSLDGKKNATLEIIYGSQNYKSSFEVDKQKIITVKFKPEIDKEIIKAIVSSNSDVEIATKHITVEKTLIQKILDIINNIFDKFSNWLSI